MMQRKNIKAHLSKYRLWLGFVVALAITLFSMSTIGKPVPLRILVLIGAARFIYCILIWYLYFFCSRISLRYKIFNFIVYMLLCIILLIPLIIYNMWVNQLVEIFYPPYVDDPPSLRNLWDYYIYFYFFRGLAMGVIVFTIQYREELVAEKQKVKLDYQKLTQQNLMIQLEALKQQVSPHFLFNTLNSLKALIATNSGQAERYTVELSNVYRYLLNHRKTDSVSLLDEMNFLRSYISLLQLRFEDNFSVSLAIDPAFNLYRIIPLSLQILVENVVKHNIITKDKPLLVNIYTDQTKRLVVENEIQPRLTTEDPGGYGLYHLNEQYKLQTGREIEIVKEVNKFTVRLPLTLPDTL